jgi:hypothetical protein
MGRWRRIPAEWLQGLAQKNIIQQVLRGLLGDS